MSKCLARFVVALILWAVLKTSFEVRTSQHNQDRIQ